MTTAAAAEADLLHRLRTGDEAAFEALIARHHDTMLAVASAYVRTRAVAEEVVQETWLAVIEGLDRFEGRSSLRTWILAILVNKAKTRGVREARSIPFTALEGDERAVPRERFRGPDDRYPGHWREVPRSWHASADTAAADRETLQVVVAAIAGLPPAQLTVIRMRDVEGYSAGEVCDALAVSEGNQRVLLHRARSRVRAALERHFDD